MNSYTSPWKEFVPDLMIAFTTPPVAFPYSAEKPPVRTENS